MPDSLYQYNAIDYFGFHYMPRQSVCQLKYLPLLFQIQDSACLIIGGGKIATRRASVIAAAGAKIDLISIEATDDIREHINASGGRFDKRAWSPYDIKAVYQFVIAATNDDIVNQSITSLCRSKGILVHSVTDTSNSDFAFPTIIDRAPLTIAVSSGSASPILARLLGERINALIPSGYGRLAELVATHRTRVRKKIVDPTMRKAFWEKILTGSVAESVFSGKSERAENLLKQTLEQSTEYTQCGEVYLIGAGPGDPDLLTFRAYRLLQQADVVLYDRLVSAEILDQINPFAEKVYVGKQRSNHSVPQHDINELLVIYALEGKRVARLKGGDPFIFGRGGEEIEQLAQKGIPFQVIPGITAAAGCASYSGIPLTHRDHAQSVRFVTGQLQDGTVDLPWEQLVAPNQTVVIYMGLKGLPIISKKLIAHGLAPETPAAMIEQGTTLDQKVHCSTIKELPVLVQRVAVKPPTLLIIGTVVSLHASLDWFQHAIDAEKVVQA